MLKAQGQEVSDLGLAPLSVWLSNLSSYPPYYPALLSAPSALAWTRNWGGPLPRFPAFLATSLLPLPPLSPALGNQFLQK